MIKYDFAWPTEESISTDGQVSFDIAQRLAVYEQSHEFKAMRHEMVFKKCIGVLEGLSGLDATATSWAAYAWFQNSSAGMPILPLIEEGARDEARFWAETATPAELECYALAACDKLSGQTGHALFASRQIKRLSGALFRRMSPGEQAAFAKWINEQMTGKEPVVRQDQMTGTQE